MFSETEAKIQYYRQKGGELFAENEKLAVSYFQD